MTKDKLQNKITCNMILDEICTQDILSNIEFNDSQIIDLSNKKVNEFNFEKLESAWNDKHPYDPFKPTIICRGAKLYCDFVIVGKKMETKVGDNVTEYFEEMDLKLIDACGASFFKDVKIEHTNILEGSNFIGAHFNSKSSFCCTTFFRKVSFKSAVFDDAATFEKASFKDIVSFSDAYFKSMGVFKDDQFSGLSFFKNITADDKLIFDGAKFESAVQLFGVKSKAISFRNCSNYSSIYFEKGNIGFSVKDYISFENMLNLGQLYISWNGDNKGSIKALIMNPLSRDTLSSRADQFSLLKENYHMLGKYDWEDQATLASMECKRKASKCKLGYWVISLFDYGLSPENVSTCAVENS